MNVSKIFKEGVSSPVEGVAIHELEMILEQLIKKIAKNSEYMAKRNGKKRITFREVSLSYWETLRKEISE